MNRPGKPAKKYSQAARLHDIIRLIESRHGIAIEELAEESGVNRRTIHRDLNAISDAGYPLTAAWVGDRKLYRFITGFKDVPPVSFSLQELVTLYFLRSQLDILQGTPFHDDLAAIFRKINSVLPPRYAAHLERISRIALPLLQGRRDYSRAAELLERLRKALLFQQRVSLQYKTPSRRKAELYSVDPYTFIFYKGGLYLLGYAHNRSAVRTFALERITELCIEEERFELPAGYDPEERFRGAFGIVDEESLAVRVRFSPEVAHAVAERTWHGTQKMTRGKDGSVELAFTAGGKMEIVSWILSYGSHAELLEPPGLRAELAATAARMAAVYSAAGGGCSAQSV
jgi:predicted DNA-binding transcriptional regulator YafY